MKNKDCELFSPEAMTEPRLKFKGKLKKHLDEIGSEVVKMAMENSLHPENMSDQMKIFHETAMHYDPKRDAPDMTTKLFSEWLEEENNA